MAEQDDTKLLIRQCLKGKRKAQYDLYRVCFSFLLPVCMRYESNEEDARAMLNEGFLKILDNLKKYKTEVPFEAWCKRIMINTIIDNYRKNRRQSETIEYPDVNQNGEQLGVALNDAWQVLADEDLEKMLQALPANSRKVFNLYAIDGYSHKEISDKLGISTGTSKWHLSNARQKLQQTLKAMINPSKKLVL